MSRQIQCINQSKPHKSIWHIGIWMLPTMIFLALTARTACWRRQNSTWAKWWVPSYPFLRCTGLQATKGRVLQLWFLQLQSQV
jgi:hypothetical protein